MACCKLLFIIIIELIIFEKEIFLNESMQCKLRFETGVYYYFNLFAYMYFEKQKCLNFKSIIRFKDDETGKLT
jgi:hypothetical protein